MRVLSSVKRDRTVKKALKNASREINDELSEVPGSIAGLESSIGVGPSGAHVQLTVMVDRRKIRSKKIYWINESGSSDEEALSRAKRKINLEIKNILGEIADFHVEFVSPPLPKRVYVTIIIGVNKKAPAETGNLTTEKRRARLAEILNLLGNEARAINISRTARVFDVSREVIYRDLGKLGLER